MQIDSEYFIKLCTLILEADQNRTYVEVMERQQILHVGFVWFNQNF